MVTLRHGSRWQAYTYTRENGKKKQINLGCYATKQEALAAEQRHREERGKDVLQDGHGR